MPHEAPHMGNTRESETDTRLDFASSSHPPSCAGGPGGGIVECVYFHHHYIYFRCVVPLVQLFTLKFEVLRRACFLAFAWSYQAQHPRLSPGQTVATTVGSGERIVYFSTKHTLEHLGPQASFQNTIAGPPWCRTRSSILMLAACRDGTLQRKISDFPRSSALMGR